MRLFASLTTDCNAGQHNRNPITSQMNLKPIALQLRSADGAEIAEAAMVLPLVFMLLLGIVWFGRAFNIYSTITQAAQQGAIAAARDAGLEAAAFAGGRDDARGARGACVLLTAIIVRHACTRRDVVAAATECGAAAGVVVSGGCARP